MCPASFTMGRGLGVADEALPARLIPVEDHSHLKRHRGSLEEFSLLHKDSSDCLIEVWIGAIGGSIEMQSRLGRAALTEQRHPQHEMCQLRFRPERQHPLIFRSHLGRVAGGCAMVIACRASRRRGDPMSFGDMRKAREFPQPERDRVSPIGGSGLNVDLQRAKN